MKIKIWLLAVFLAPMMTLRADTNDLAALLQKGLLDQVANRDPKSAVSDFQYLMAQYDHERQITATAIYRLGECYRKLGQLKPAIAEYERLIREFSDQGDLVALSEQNLAGLGVDGSQISLPSTGTATGQTASVTALATTTVPPSATISENRHRPLGEDDREDQEIQRLQNNPDSVTSSGEIDRAARSGELRVAAYLLDHGAKIEGDGNKNSPLIIAAENGKKAMVDFLLERGANVNAGENSGHSALLAAADGGFYAIVAALLAHKADIDATNQTGGTPLILAVANDYVKVSQKLLVAGANPNAKDTSGSTPLLLAAQNGDAEAVKLLLVAGAESNFTNSSGMTPLACACRTNADDCVKLLLEAKADPNGGSLDAPLCAAVFNTNTAMTDRLLQAGARPSAIGPMDYGPGPRFTQMLPWTPLYEAVYSHQPALVQLLLKYHADPDADQTDKKSLLFKALSDTNVLEAMLDAGAKVDIRDPSDRHWFNKSANWTPLLTAVRNAGAEPVPITAVAILLKHGANPNLTDDLFGNSALQWTPGWPGFGWERIPDRQVVELLLDNKADPNHKNLAGKTLLDETQQALNQQSPAVLPAIQSLQDLLARHTPSGQSPANP